jgi:hypothetical protein
MKAIIAIICLLMNILSVYALSCKSSESTFSLASSTNFNRDNCDTTSKWCKRVTILYIDEDDYGNECHYFTYTNCILPVTGSSMNYSCSVSGYDDAAMDAYCDKNAADTCHTINVATKRVR